MSIDWHAGNERSAAVKRIVVEVTGLKFTDVRVNAGRGVDRRCVTIRTRDVLPFNVQQEVIERLISERLVGLGVECVKYVDGAL